MGIRMSKGESRSVSLQAIKAWGEGQWRYSSTLSNKLAVVRSEWSALYSQYFTPRERAPVPITRDIIK